jgi:hypothetical protein
LCIGRPARVHRLVQRLRDLVHVAAGQLDRLDRHLLALGIVKLLDEGLDRREFLFGGLDNDLRSRRHRPDLRASRSAAPASRLTENGLHRVGHLLRPGVVQLKETLLGGLLGDVLIHPQGKVLNLLHVRLVGLHDQRIGDRLGLDQRPARRAARPAPAHEQRLDLLLNLGRVGVDQRQDFDLVADALHVERLEQAADFVQRGTHRVDPQLVPVRLNRDG